MLNPTYLLYDLSYTLVEVPMNSMIVSLTDNVDERNSILQFKGILSGIFTVLAGVVWMFLISEHVGFSMRAVAIVSSVIFFIMMLPLATKVKEHNVELKKVSIVPLEVIVRNISAGSFAKRYGVEEGIVFDAPTIEFSYKNDDLGDPLMNSYHALALKLATQEEIDLIKKYAFAVNDLLRGFMKKIGIDLVDFKLEFGKTSDGTIVLADEISPDTCRLWDEQTHEKLDKDRFRRDMGGAEEAYEEVMRRLMGDQ